MQLLPMASSPDGLISARSVITKTPGWEALTTTSIPPPSPDWEAGALHKRRHLHPLKACDVSQGHKPVLVHEFDQVLVRAEVAGTEVVLHLPLDLLLRRQGISV